MNLYGLGFTILKNGDLEITTDKPNSLRDSYENLDADYSLYDAFDWLTSNGLNWINPEDIGALTSAPILSDSPCNDDGTFPVDMKVFWFPEYQVESPLRTLVETGKVVFTAAEEAL